MASLSRLSPAPEKTSATGGGLDKEFREPGKKDKAQPTCKGRRKRAGDSRPLFSPASPALLLLGLVRQLQQHVVHQAELLGLGGGEIAIAFRFFFNLLDRLAGMAGQDRIEQMAILKNLVGLDLYV